MNNTEIAKKLTEIAQLLNIQGDKVYRIRAYQKAATALQNFPQNLAEIYKEKKSLPKIPGIGRSIEEKITEFLETGKIKYLDSLQKDSAIRQVVTYFFETKGVDLTELKNNARKQKIVYSRYTKPAKQLIELAGSVQSAKDAIKKVADWANSRKLDYAIETVFKKWLELDRLQPKEIVKKPFYDGNPMYWSQARQKWYVINKSGEWLEYADKEDKIEWRIVVD